jgi:hypothetical protein
MSSLIIWHTCHLGNRVIVKRGGESPLFLQVAYVQLVNDDTSVTLLYGYLLHGRPPHPLILGLQSGMRNEIAYLFKTMCSCSQYYPYYRNFYSVNLWNVFPAKNIALQVFLNVYDSFFLFFQSIITSVSTHNRTIVCIGLLRNNMVTAKYSFLCYMT